MISKEEREHVKRELRTNSGSHSLLYITPESFFGSRQQDSNKAGAISNNEEIPTKYTSTKIASIIGEIIKRVGREGVARFVVDEAHYVDEVSSLTNVVSRIINRISGRQPENKTGPDFRAMFGNIYTIRERFPGEDISLVEECSVNYLSLFTFIQMIFRCPYHRFDGYSYPNTS